MPKKEQDIQYEIERVIRKHDGYVYKNAQSMYTPVGIPDLTACIPVTISGYTVGLFVAVECKLNHKKYDASEAQQIVGRKISAAHGIWLKCESPSELDKYLTAIQSMYNMEDYEL